LAQLEESVLRVIPVFLACLECPAVRATVEETASADKVIPVFPELRVIVVRTAFPEPKDDPATKDTKDR